MNADWHRRHVMPKNPTPAQRIAWHRAHAKHCACRPIPPKLAALMKSAAPAWKKKGTTARRESTAPTPKKRATTSRRKSAR